MHSLPAGMPSAWLTNQPQKTNGAARTRPHGCSHAATTTSWCATTARRCWWRRACSWGGWVSCWTTTTTHCPSTTPWTPSTFTPSRSPSSCPLYPLSWSGTSRSWSSQGCPSPTLSMVWPQIFKSSNSSRWACADKSHHTWRGWRPATEKGPGKRPCRVHSGPGTERLIGGLKDVDSVTEFCSSALRADQFLSYRFRKCWKYAHQSGNMSVLLVCSYPNALQIHQWMETRSVDCKH